MTAPRTFLAVFSSALLALVLAAGAAFAAPTASGDLHPAVSLAPLDRAALAEEDAVADSFGGPMRFAVPHPVAITPESDGSWHQLDDGRLMWRLRLQAADAAHINLGFSRFRLPEGGRLDIRATDGSARLRTFTAADQQPDGQLWTPVLHAADLMVEVIVPAAGRYDLELTLSSINQGYRGFGIGAQPGAGAGASPFAKSGSCNVDVACPEGNGWRDQIRSVAVYSLGGARICTGVLMNNTAEDLTPYFLTANHCDVVSGNAGSVVVYWNYANIGCRTPGGAASGSPGNGPLGQNQSGAVLRAAHAPSDMTLLELLAPPNLAWNVYWAGWDRRSAAPLSGVGIHHPQGEEKRISFENNATTTTSYLEVASPGNGTHIRVIDWDVGTTEPGSSGSPLFSPQKRVVGQLHGGFAACGNDDSDWYGRLSVAWTGGGSAASRLSNWLDPLGTSANVLDGLDMDDPPPPPPPPPEQPATPTGLTAEPASTTAIELFWQDQADNEDGYRILQSLDGVDFDEAATVDADTESVLVAALMPATEYFFRVEAFNAAGGSGPSNTASAITDTDPFTCVEDGITLCLNQGRFQVTMTFNTVQGAMGDAQKQTLTQDTGYFYYQNPNNVEAVIKVINACVPMFDRYWVFAGGLTNVNVVLTVIDSQTGRINRYENPQETPFEPIQDTDAFATCP